jgi:hypothetical protein
LTKNPIRTLIKGLALRFKPYGLDVLPLYIVWLFDSFNANDKTNLAPYRALHFVVIALLVARFLPKDWKGLQWPDLYQKCPETDRHQRVGHKRQEYADAKYRQRLLSAFYKCRRDTRQDSSRNDEHRGRRRASPELSIRGAAA